jgi:hypothetical protein
MSSAPAPRLDRRPRRGQQAAAQECQTTASTGAGAAGQRLAGAALEHAQVDVLHVEHLHVAGVDPLREARMPDSIGGLGRHRCGVDIGHHLHRVRVAVDRAVM